jgi:FtsH-binding integral membrane protein
MPLASTSFAIVLAAGLGIISAICAALLPDPTTTTALSLVDDNRLRLICVAGSLGGAVMSVMLFQVKTNRELAAKLTTSALAGIMFSPMLLRYLRWADLTDAILATSAIVALLSWTVLQSAVPILAGIAKRKVEALDAKEHS